MLLRDDDRKDSIMQRFDLTRMCSERGLRETPYLEFLRVPTMSAGLYRLPVGALDRQQPHHEDEVYYILKGRGMIEIGDERQPVEPGILMYVPAHTPHRFYAISEDLTVLALFAPAEHAQQQAHPS
jgi:mannose-6-phosphate isomerase-like protein (cupin superfamily)